MKADWQTKDGQVRLYLGDCAKVLQEVPSVGIDALITDPPYGINLDSHGQRFVRDDIRINGDDSLMAANYVREWAKDITTCMFFSPYRPMVGWRSVLVWHKGGAVGIGGDRETCWKRTFELIGVERNRTLNETRDDAVLYYQVTQNDFKLHPCQKPVVLMEYLVRKLTNRGDLVIDPFMGSGTTGVACAKLGRKFVGIEADKQYYTTSVRRIELELSQGNFLSEVLNEA